MSNLTFLQKALENGPFVPIKSVSEAAENDIVYLAYWPIEGEQLDAFIIARYDPENGKPLAEEGMVAQLYKYVQHTDEDSLLRMVLEKALESSVIKELSPEQVGQLDEHSGRILVYDLDEVDGTVILEQTKVTDEIISSFIYRPKEGEAYQPFF